MNWDDAKYFLAVARAGQMLGAATRLGVSQAKLSRRISSLEAALGVKLFERSPGGCELSEEGASLLEIATRIEAEFLRAQATFHGAGSAVSGTVRIGAPDGFGVAYLAARLERLGDRFPDLHIQLVPVSRSFSLSQREADIAVMVGRPLKGRLRTRKLTDYSLSVYAARRYLQARGTPTTVADLSAHRLVGYVEDLIFSPDLNYATQIMRDWQSQVEVSSAPGQLEAVRAGAGIGVLHDFMAQAHPELVRLFPEATVVRSYWTVWHESMKNTRRVTALAQFLDDIVRPDHRLFMPDAGAR